MATLDNLYVMAKIFGLALFLIVVLVAWNILNSSDITADIWDQTATTQHIRNNTQNAMDNSDFMFIAAYFGLHIGIIVLAYWLRSHPVVYIAGVFIIIIMMMIAAPLSNAWQNVAAQSLFSTAASTMSKTNYIMSHLPLFEVVFGFLTLIAFAAFARQEALI